MSALVLSVATLAALSPQATALEAGGPKAAQGSQYPALSQDGRFMAFTTSSKLSPLDTSFVSDVYVRDLDTGTTLLASRASGPGGAAANGSSIEQKRGSISADGRYVVFDSSATNLSPADADTTNDVYVRDIQTGTTTLASRATGAAGAKGNGQSSLSQISGDGRYVVFESSASNLDPADTDTGLDVYVRDLQANTTILVDRANGVTGAKPPQGFSPSISGNGRYVAFASNGANLTPDDPDTNVDTFVRDLQTGTTTLASRASGATGVKGNSFSGQPQISADGLHVAWIANASNLDPADTDGTADAYMRDLQTNTTYLVSRATGASGVKSNGQSGAHFLSADGRYVAWGTDGTNVDPADTDSAGDLYVRDVQAATTTLVTRASGAGGAKSNAANANLALSGDGRYAAFFGTATNLSPDDTDAIQDVYVRDLQTFVTSLESRGTPGYARPRGATPYRASLVPAYVPCSAPNRTHGSPLAFPSCAPTGQISPYLTLGTPDANGAGANSIGYVLMKAMTGDFLFQASITDVRCTANVTACGAANAAGGPDYLGGLRADIGRRQTDRNDGSGDQVPATGSDGFLSVSFFCSPTGTSVGSTCTISTTANAVVPGAIRDGDRTVMGFNSLSVTDGGTDGDPDTADNVVFAKPGVFIP